MECLALHLSAFAHGPILRSRACFEVALCRFPPAVLGPCSTGLVEFRCRDGSDSRHLESVRAGANMRFDVVGDAVCGVGMLLHHRVSDHTGAARRHLPDTINMPCSFYSTKRSKQQLSEQLYLCPSSTTSALTMARMTTMLSCCHSLLPLTLFIRR